MRSALVLAANASVHNRYLLTKLAAKAARKLHRPKTRIADTINGALLRLADGQQRPGRTSVTKERN